MGKAQKTKTDKTELKKTTSHKFVLFNVFLVIVLLTVITLSYAFFIGDRIIPKTFIGDRNVSFLTKTEAFQKINFDISKRTEPVLRFQYRNTEFAIDLISASPTINYSKALDEAFATGHTSSAYRKISDHLWTIVHEQRIIPEVALNIAPQLEKIAKQVDQQPQDATVWLDEKNIVHITEGVNGQILNKAALSDEVIKYITTGTFDNTLPIKNVLPSFTTLQAQNAKQALETVQKNPIKLKSPDREWIIDTPTLFHLLKMGHASPHEDNENTLLDVKKLSGFLQDLAASIDQPVQEPLFKFDSSHKRVSEFRPGKAGSKLNIEEANSLITKAVTGQIGNEITLPIETTQPKILNSQVNNLGINELLASGVSHFAGSIPNRIYNVNLTAGRINGVLIAPGETFSFVKTVGEINAETGFKQAYVIKEGRTVLDDGGGVCQVSTTLFRAALNGGLPILDRTAHAYRVGYYEQGFPPGLDATVFYPSVDFKFKNDTGSHILIQASAQGTTLQIDLYGTPDGRVASLTTPVVSDQTPPPPELRQDDPSLPRGQVKQVDWSAWGARVSFKRTVTKNGETIAQETWRSNYKPWQAVYLVGTQ